MSDKPLAERLQVKAARRIAVVDAPAGLDAAVDVADKRAPLGEAEVVLLFVADRAAMEVRLGEVVAGMAPSAILWVAYPKLTSRLAKDLSRDVFHALLPSRGLDTVSQIAVDEDWSALRLKRV